MVLTKILSEVNAMNNDRKLKITRKLEDNYKVFSVRIKKSTTKELDKISKETNRSRNELINVLLEYGIKNIDMEE